MRTTTSHCYYVYILTNIHKTVFCVGVTNDLKLRLAQHYSQRGNVATYTGRCNVQADQDDKFTLGSCTGAPTRTSKYQRFAAPPRTTQASIVIPRLRGNWASNIRVSAILGGSANCSSIKNARDIFIKSPGIISKSSKTFSLETVKDLRFARRVFCLS